MLDQRIRKFLKTNRFLMYWLTEIQSDSVLYGRKNEESVCLVSFNMWFCVERLLNLKKFPKKRQGVFKKTEIVLISVHLETGR